jgi:hypothetical protein
MPTTRALAAAALMLAAGCGSSSPTAPVGLPAPGQVPAVAPPPPPTQGGAGETLAYWQGVNELPRQVQPLLTQGPAAHARGLRAAAAVIRRQPTLGIDPDLVNWALGMADLMERRAELIERSRSPALLAEAFARGWGGDPFGAALELNQEERALLADFREHSRAWHRLRAALTARYGVQF